MINDSILNFQKQFKYVPEIINERDLKKTKKFVVVGMGGSHLAADLIKIFKPSVDLTVHTNYGLPALNDLKKRLIILSSYSGNTEEVIDAFHKAKEMKLKIVVITLGGKLLELARANNVPYIQLPDMNLQPRMALGLSLMALLTIMGEKKILSRARELSQTFKPAEFESRGQDLAQKLKGYIPVIYSSVNNSALAYNWKIKFNENAKAPAFCNILPELNHNEMEGFDMKESDNNFSKKFYCLIFSDDMDDPRILKRMEILEKLYRSRGLKTEIIKIEGYDIFQKVFNIIILGDWAAYHTALLYGVDPETVPMVEEFKKMMQ